MVLCSIYHYITIHENENGCNLQHTLHAYRQQVKKYYNLLAMGSCKLYVECQEKQRKTSRTKNKLCTQKPVIIVLCSHNMAIRNNTCNGDEPRSFIISSGWSHPCQDECLEVSRNSCKSCTMSSSRGTIGHMLNIQRGEHECVSVRERERERERLQ